MNESLRDTLTATLGHLLALSREDQIASFVLSFQAGQVDRLEISIGPLPLDTSTGPAEVEATVPRATEFTPTQEIVLEVLRAADKPIKARTIATRGGITYNSHLRKVIVQLVKDGLVIPCDGYMYRAGDPPPTRPAS